MKILVTGGAGYIGSVTSKRLLDEGHEVIVYDNLSNGKRESVDSRCSFIQGCLSDKKLLEEIFRKLKVDSVMHFAGFIEAGESMKDPSKFFWNNVSNGVNLLDAMVKNNVKKIIFSSSVAVYANTNSPLKEEDPKIPTNFYGATKLTFERVLSWYDLIHQIKYISLRYSNAIGVCGDLGENHDPETHLIPLAILTALGKREKFYLFGTDYETPDKTCIRDFIDVKDLADAHILALNNLGEISKVYNVGTGKGTSVREVLDAVRAEVGSNFEIVEADKREGDPAILVADPEKIKRELGWSSKCVFKDSLSQTIKYFQKKFP